MKLLFVTRLFVTLSGDRGAGFAAPAEVGAVRPHPVQYDSKAACDGDDRPPLRDLHPPGVEARPIPALGRQDLRCFVQHRSQHADRKTTPSDVKRSIWSVTTQAVPLFSARNRSSAGVMATRCCQGI